MNLAGNDEDRDPMLVTGDHVVPAEPDDHTQNKAPSYPRDAVRRRSQGRVGLIIHVAESGTVAWIDITASSGDPMLDTAAQDAISKWHFQPARAAGRPVPFDFPYSINFTLDGQRRSTFDGAYRPGYDTRR